MAVLLFENAETVHRRNPAINAEKNAEILSDEKINFVGKAFGIVGNAIDKK